MSAKPDRLLIILALLALPCHALAAPEVAPAVPPPTRCEVDVTPDGMRLHSSGAARRLPLTIEGLEPRWLVDLVPVDMREDEDPPLACLPTPAGDALLFAVVGTYSGALHSYTVARDGRLWRAPAPGSDTTGPVSAKLLRREEDADFAASAFTPDGRALTYSGATGLSLFELGSGKVTRLVRTEPQAGEDCWVQEQRLVDISPRWSADGTRVWFTRGGYCGFEGDFLGKRMVFVPATKRLLAARPVPTVAVGADGAVYYGDAGPCEDHGLVSPSHKGWIFRSTDGGATFLHIAVRFRSPADAEPRVMENAARTILADPTDPARLVVLSAVCEDDARGSRGGDLFATLDGGQTWRRLGPLGPPTPDWEYEGIGLDAVVAVAAVAPVAAVAAVAAGLDELVAWRGRREAWKTSDGGRRWSRLRPPPPRPPAASPASIRPDALGVERIHHVLRHQKIPTTLFAATSDGLHRSRDDGRTWERIAR